MFGNYKLEGHTPVECADPKEWGAWLQGADKRVALDRINGVDISTVFLGVDYQFGEGPPILFETMVFGGKLDSEMERYETWDEAEAGHQAMKQRVVLAENKETK